MTNCVPLLHHLFEFGKFLHATIHKLTTVITPPRILNNKYKLKIYVGMK